MKKVSLSILFLVVLTVKGSNGQVETLLNQAKSDNYNDSNTNQQIENVQNELQVNFESHKGTISKFEGFIDSEGKSAASTQIVKDTNIQSGSLHRPQTLTLPQPMSSSISKLYPELENKRNQISSKNSTQNSYNAQDQSQSSTIELMPINTPLEREEAKIIEESQPKVNQVRQKLQQSQIQIKLKKKQNFIGKNIETLNITFFNETTSVYDSFILFHEKSEATFNMSVYYFLDQKNKTIILTKQLDSNGNVIYRNLKINFQLVLYGATPNNVNINNNQKLKGYITYGDDIFAAQYQLDGSQWITFGNSNQFSKDSFTYNNGQANYQYGWGDIYNDKSASSSSTYQQDKSIKNGSLNHDTQNSHSSGSSHNSEKSISFENNDHQFGQFEIDNSDSSSYSIGSSERQTLTGENFTYSHWDDKSGNFANSNDNNEQNINNIQISNSEGNTIKINNYSLTNQTLYTDNSKEIYTKGPGSQYAYYGVMPSTPEWVYETNLQSNGNHEKSITINNQTNSLNDTYQNSSSISGSTKTQTYNSSQKEEGWGNNFYNQQENNFNQTHSIEVSNNLGESITTGTIDETFTNSMTSGGGGISGSKTEHKTHASFTDYNGPAQQFNQFRGSKKTTGQSKNLNMSDVLDKNHK